MPPKRKKKAKFKEKKPKKTDINEENKEKLREYQLKLQEEKRQR